MPNLNFAELIKSVISGSTLHILLRNPKSTGRLTAEAMRAD